jgi:hypothetical protein
VLPANEPLGALQVTVPVGALGATDDVSVTVTAQVVAEPTVGVADAHVTADVVAWPPLTAAAPVRVFTRNAPLQVAGPGTQSFTLALCDALARVSACNETIAPDVTPRLASVIDTSMLEAAPLLQTVTAHRCCAAPIVANVPSGLSSSAVATPEALKVTQMRALAVEPPVVSKVAENASLVILFLLAGRVESQRTKMLVPSAVVQTLVNSVEPPPASVLPS